ncbi:MULTISPECIES: hypothetical protein [unclassified Crossiella]|uniref:hypothetical protein n=1 Tax=unclassified Crossiella TaxID=2620835 RepID=UPI002000209E|nr:MULTISPECIES: hypothetical protein [unclassified Crossiella]MCK2240954.1 hypothetical protein [Crossiella sp. S99.2]MCK2253902.1 hypothetical protein [Crossiella sp. S99.1]
MTHTRTARIPLPEPPTIRPAADAPPTARPVPWMNPYTTVLQVTRTRVRLRRHQAILTLTLIGTALLRPWTAPTGRAPSGPGSRIRKAAQATGLICTAVSLAATLRAAGALRHADCDHATAIAQREIELKDYLASGGPRSGLLIRWERRLWIRSLRRWWPIPDAVPTAATGPHIARDDQIVSAATRPVMLGAVSDNPAAAGMLVHHTPDGPILYALPGTSGCAENTATP